MFIGAEPDVVTETGTGQGNGEWLKDYEDYYTRCRNGDNERNLRFCLNLLTTHSIISKKVEVI